MTPLQTCTLDCICSRAKACFQSGNENTTRSLTLSPASRELLWQRDYRLRTWLSASVTDLNSICANVSQ